MPYNDHDHETLYLVLELSPPSIPYQATVYALFLTPSFYLLIQKNKITIPIFLIYILLNVKYL